MPSKPEPKEALKRPPKPPMAIRVGIIGHRDILPQERDRITKDTIAALEIIRKKTTDVHAAEQEYYAADLPKLICITSLSAGGDQIGARCALDQGYKIHALIPFERSQYEAHNFATDPHAAAEFAALKSGCEKTLELDPVQPGGEQAAYATAGSILVQSSDIVIAIWDGNKVRKPGGTYDSILKAEAGGTPVVWIHANSGQAPLLKTDGKDWVIARLNEYVADLLRPQGKDQWKRYLNESEKRWTIGPIYQFVAGLLARRVLIKSPRLPAYNEKSETDWKLALEFEWSDAARDHFQPFDTYADNLAIYYASMTRGLFTINLFAGALAIQSSLATRLWPQNPWVIPLSWIEAMLGILVVALFAWSRLWKMHPRWLHYRTLSELVRAAALTSVTGEPARLVPRRKLKEEPLSAWVVSYASAVVRAFGLAKVSPSPDYYEGCRKLLVRRLRSQAEYHQHRHEFTAMISKDVRYIGIALFLMSLSGCILQFVTLMGMRERLSIPETTWHDVAGLASFAAVLGAAIAGFATQAEFSKLAQVSGMVGPRLEALARRLDSIGIVTGRELREAAIETAEILLEEHEDWHLFYSLREIEYPK